MCCYYNYYQQMRQPFGPGGLFGPGGPGGQFGPGGPFGPGGSGGPGGPFAPSGPGGPGIPGGPGGGPQLGPPSPGGAGQPPAPPPSFTPSQSQAQTFAGPGVFAVDPGAIRPCVRRYVFIWLDSGQRFWAWLVFVGRRSAAGWRWTGRRWVYFGIDLDRIESFICF